MKIKHFVLSLFIFCLFFVNMGLCVRDFTVGVSPGVVKMGKVEAGTTEIVTFFIITPSEETLLVSLEPIRGRLDFFNKGGYKDLIFNFSEEDVTSWVNIINNPVELKPSNETLVMPGGVIRGQREITFLLEIPKDADPGYHLVNINPVPRAPPEEMGQVGTRIIAITSVNVLFNIAGEAVRRGVILDTEEGKYNGENLEIKTYFQNTGTTTITAKARQKIYDSEENLVKELSSHMDYFSPGEIKPLKSYLTTTGLSLGDYKIFTTVDYTTNTTTKASTITLKEIPEIVPKEELIIPVWLIILALILIAMILIYRRIQ